MALPAIPSIVATNQYYQLALQALYALSGQGPNPAGLSLSVGGSPVSATFGLPIVDAYTNPIVATWTSATPQNTATQVSTSGMDTVVVTLVTQGSHSGGTVAFEVYDGAAWIPVKAASVSDYTTTSTSTLGANFNKGYQIPVAGFPAYRSRLASSISSGTLTITTVVSSAPDTSIVTVGVDPSSTLPYIAAPSGPINGQQATTSSAAALPSNTVTTGVIVTNTGATNAVYIGNSGLTSGNGYSLAAGASVGLVVSNTNSIYILNGSGGSSTVSFIGS